MNIPTLPPKTGDDTTSRFWQELEAKLAPKEISEVVALSDSQQTWLGNAMEKLNLSARSCHRLLRVARTIADLAQSDTVEMPHLAEALNFRAR